MFVYVKKSEEMGCVKERNLDRKQEIGLLWTENELGKG